MPETVALTRPKRKNCAENVEAVKILHPRVYTTFIDKVQDL